MSETLNTLASENLNPSLRSLLEDVARGNIRVPRFQRPFVWKDVQRLELLQSIRDNIPIGSLLVWSTTKFNLASFPSIGPHRIPEHITPSAMRGWQYLLDGHQRVSTLLGVLLQAAAPPIATEAADDDDLNWDIRYDLSAQDFVFANKPKTKLEGLPLLPLWTLLDGRVVNRHMRAMRERAESQLWAEQDFELWEERADQLSYRFQQCRIPVVAMVTDDLSLAARAFQRVNTLGTPMGEAHLVAALTWSETFDLRERLAALRETFPIGWGEMEDRHILQVCKGLIESDWSMVNEIDLVDAIKKDESLLEKAADGLRQAINLLVHYGGVVRLELLPYSNQLLFLAVEIARRSPAAVPEQAYMAWFWRAAWTEAFGSASFQQARVTQAALRNPAIGQADENGSGESAPLKLRFDRKVARVRLWMLRMAARPGLLDENGQEMNARELLAAHGTDAFAKLLRTPGRASKELRLLLQTLGNRFLVAPPKAQALRGLLTGTADVSDAILDAHFVDRDALKALRAGDLETFIKMRNQKFTEWDSAEWQREKARA